MFRNPFRMNEKAVLVNEINCMEGHEKLEKAMLEQVDHVADFYHFIFSSPPAVSAKIQYRIPTLCHYGLLVVLSEYASMPFIHPICSRNSHDSQPGTILS